MREAMRQIPWPYFQRQQLRHVAEVLFVVRRFRVRVANAQAGVLGLRRCAISCGSVPRTASAPSALSASLPRFG